MYTQAHICTHEHITHRYINRHIVRGRREKQEKRDTIISVLSSAFLWESIYLFFRIKLLGIFWGGFLFGILFMELTVVLR